MMVIAALREDDHKFEASLIYTASFSPCVKKEGKTERERERETP
jgi:hypothetical protein